MVAGISRFRRLQPTGTPEALVSVASLLEIARLITFAKRRCPPPATFLDRDNSLGALDDFLLLSERGKGLHLC
jgi:hypothetical protein